MKEKWKLKLPSFKIYLLGKFTDINQNLVNEMTARCNKTVWCIFSKNLRILNMKKITWGTEQRAFFGLLMTVECEQRILSKIVSDRLLSLAFPFIWDIIWLSSAISAGGDRFQSFKNSNAGNRVWNICSWVAYSRDKTSTTATTTLNCRIREKNNCFG